MEKHNPWYKRILHEKRKEILTSAITLVSFSLVVAIWHYFTGKAFQWESISPIEAPDLLPRLFYSALVFVTIGSFLYHKLKFWKFLYEPYRGGGRRAYREYQKLKGAVWAILILLMYFVIVPFVVDLLNTVLSFLYNIYVLFLYLAPPLAITALLYGLYRVVQHQLLPQKHSTR